MVGEGIFSLLSLCVVMRWFIQRYALSSQKLSLVDACEGVPCAAETDVYVLEQMHKHCKNKKENAAELNHQNPRILHIHSSELLCSWGILIALCKWHKWSNSTAEQTHRGTQEHPGGTRKTSPNFSNLVFQTDQHHSFRDRLTKPQLFRTLKARNSVFT